MDERRRIIEYFQKNGVLIQSEAVDFLIESGDALKNSKKLLGSYDEKPLGIMIDDVKSFFDNGASEGGMERLDELPNTYNPPNISRGESEEIELEILEDVTGKSSCEGTISDFTHLFKNRYEMLYGLLKKRQEMRNVVPLKNAQRREGDVSVIGIVSEIKRGKNSHVLVEIEDESDSATIYFPDNLADAASNLVEDEVIGIVGKG
ncbi:MAG: hypothetical protein J7J34_02015, partial [Thermoplasmata archaeon]|nr:hypothetical protein [Thermoplasmata archaeon]